MPRWTTQTTSTTSTVGKECETPTDPFGNYTKTPYSLGDNTSWRLTCNESYFASRGLTLAKCLGNGVLRPAGICRKSGCNGAEANWPAVLGTTCPAILQEGEMCTYRKCDYDSKKEVLGHFTCIRSRLMGGPICINREAKFWAVSWVMPKIIGGFDFSGTLMRWVNMSNDTISAFESNVTQTVCDCLVGIYPWHFTFFQVHHLWESKDMFDSETGRLMSQERTHLFSVNYELLIWDRNVFKANEALLMDIFNWDDNARSGSETAMKFAELMYARANITLVDLFPTNVPISFNASVLAADTEIADVAAPCRIDARLLMLLLAISITCHGS
jgi:hypothetical protein